MPSSARMTSSAADVGVPHTAAVGCSASTRPSTVAPSATTPVTSVARCMTLGRCRTNGVSGTFIDVQCGARASATERTAYSCSSRSLLDRASEAASARSRASSPVRRIVPASTREVTNPRRRRTSSSGVAPTRPATANVHAAACRSASRANGQRMSTGSSAVASRSRARTTFSRSPAAIRRTASATEPAHSAPDTGPVGEVGAERTPRRRRRAEVGHRGERPVADGSDPGAVPAASDDDCRHQQHRRLVVLTVEGEGGERNEATAGQSYVVAHDRVSHQAVPPLGRLREPVGASELEPGASPQPTMPSPWRTHAKAAVSGRRSRSAPGNARSTVRTTSCGWTPGLGEPPGLSWGASVTPMRVGAGRPYFSSGPRSAHRPPPGRLVLMARAQLDKQPHEVAAMFDGVARRYDLTNDVLSLGLAHTWRRAVVSRGPPGPRRADPGPGSRDRHEQHPFDEAGAYVVPCDFSLGMLAGRQRPAASRVHRRRCARPALRRRDVRRGDDLLRPAQRARHRRGSRRAAAGHAARRSPGGL